MMVPDQQQPVEEKRERSGVCRTSACRHCGEVLPQTLGVCGRFMRLAESAAKKSLGVGKHSRGKGKLPARTPPSKPANQPTPSRASRFKFTFHYAPRRVQGGTSCHGAHL